jgi:O-antigen ligase
MDPESKNKWLGISCLILCSTVMILTFSRGGLYFLAITIAVYLFFNRQKMGSYFKFIIFIPIAYFIYTLVTTQTGGKIEERYKQQGASNREILVDIGFDIFADDPILGVGTSNYAVEVKRRSLFSEESGAHNEFVRSAAEHGIFGIITYWGFFIILISEILTRRPLQKQYGIYFVVLFTLVIIHNGLKISVQPVILMLAVGMPSLIKRKITNVVAPSQFARAS